MARRSRSQQADADDNEHTEDPGGIVLPHDTNLAPGEGTAEDGLLGVQDQMVRMTSETTVGRVDTPHVPTESALAAGKLADRDDPRQDR